MRKGGGRRRRRRRPFPGRLAEGIDAQRGSGLGAKVPGMSGGFWGSLEEEDVRKLLLWWVTLVIATHEVVLVTPALTTNGDSPNVVPQKTPKTMDEAVVANGRHDRLAAAQSVEIPRCVRPNLKGSPGGRLGKQGVTRRTGTGELVHEQYDSSPCLASMDTAGCGRPSS